MRDAVLLELSRGPRLRISTLVTLGVIGLILCACFVIGLVMTVPVLTSGLPRLMLTP